MDPLTIVGLVGNIVQFVSFGHEILTSVRELSSGGGLQEVEQLKLIVHDVQRNNREISEFLDDEHNFKDNVRREMRRLRGSKVEGIFERELKPLQNIADECGKIAKELLGHLNRFEMKHNGWQRKLEAIKVSGEVMWKRKEMRELKTRLLELENRLASWWTMTMLRRQGDSFKAVLASINSLGYRLDNFDNFDVNRLDTLKSNIDLSFVSIQAQATKDNGESDSTTHQSDTKADPIGQRHATDLNDTIQCVHEYIAEWHRMIRAIEVLKSLAFDSIHNRRDNIEQAHQETCLWVYDPNRTNFTEWLKSASGVYWINGLAGSGKSTLMKYVTTDKQTYSALGTWTGGRRLITASHYFWNAGTEMQKSHKGLLQTLLYQILEADPSLCDVLCADHHLGTPWKMEELTTAFERLSTMSEATNMFCFFIDGLDEYQGQEETLIRIVKSLAAAPNVKICASSRPWPAFYAEWNTSIYTFKMQDFSKADMTKYVKEYLEGSDKFKAAAALDSKCLDLIPNISDRANGVWLWVYLVVRDILRDIRDGEPFQQWQNRLESYPQELVAYFRKMMERIDPFHRKQGAEIFLLALAAIGTKIPMIGLSMLYDEDTSWCGIDHDGRLLTGADLEQMYMAWQPRLQNRCRDLMRLSRDRNYRNQCEYYEIDFLHRTVKDFLQEHYIGELRALVSPEFSEPNYLARLTFAVIEQVQLSRSSLPDDALGNLISRLFCYLREEQNVEEERQASPSHFKLVEAYDSMMVRLLAASGITNQGNPYTSWAQLVTGMDIDFTHMTIQFRLRRYSLHRLQAQRQWSRKEATMYMECALQPVLTQVIIWKKPPLDPKLVAGLIELGMDPNMHLSTGQTAWACFLHKCVKWWLGWSPAERAEALDAIRIFLRHGAKPNVVVSGRRFHDILSEMVGRDAMAEWQDLISGGRAGYGGWIGRALALPFRALGTTN
ncbi:hypothetical protein F5B22DRAFT_644897 [Xylaria bambusicola]|uniref:uncharacterized protein n=1 Tax=Xylaria bambusicola TaxID=326684 RepID=UPI0020083141|nr:uncharacterized protein F5B22DRAFT_644897 [Xylaria bambusicola]KAI0518135.1 hypothetical protein F5B22DRAFT_644897 [Xylaria bambusicola]